MYGSKALDTQQGNQAGQAGSSPGMKTLGTILGAVVLVLILTWAVSVFFEIALIKALAAVILVLFGIVVALFVFGIT